MNSCRALFLRNGSGHKVGLTIETFKPKFLLPFSNPDLLDRQQNRDKGGNIDETFTERLPSQGRFARPVV